MIDGKRNIRIRIWYMTGQWLDEVEDDGHYQPVPELEPFYILAALEFGDPDQKDWMLNHNPEFLALWRKFQHGSKCYTYSGPEAVLQYVMWYERERERAAVSSALNRRSTRP